MSTYREGTYTTTHIMFALSKYFNSIIIEVYVTVFACMTRKLPNVCVRRSVMRSKKMYYTHETKTCSTVVSLTNSQCNTRTDNMALRIYLHIITPLSMVKVYKHLQAAHTIYCIKHTNFKCYIHQRQSPSTLRSINSIRSESIHSLLKIAHHIKLTGDLLHWIFI